MADFLTQIITFFMPMETFWEIFWYLLSGVCSTAVSIVGYSLAFRKCGMGNVLAKTLSWLAAATTAFLMMRYTAFAGTETGFLESAWKFYLSRVGTILLTVAMMWYIIDIHLKWDLKDRERVKRDYRWWPEIINGAVTLFEIVLNYFLAKLWIF